MIQRALAMGRNDELLLVTTDRHVEETKLLVSVGASLGIDVCPLMLPVAAQHRYCEPEALPGVIRAAIEKCSAMMVLVEYSPEITPFRMALLSSFTQKHGKGRAASLPGVTLEQFRYAIGDFDAMDQLAQHLAEALLRVREVEIETRDRAGVAHKLRAPVSARPTMCQSVVHEGDWDNIPSGETFVLPEPKRAEGSVVIDGSVPGLVLHPEHEVLLTIKRGRVVGIQATTPQVAQHVKALFFTDESPATTLSPNSHMLCEIGFGLNKSIDRLYGTPVFDEKMYGSVHGAIVRSCGLRT